MSPRDPQEADRTFLLSELELLSRQYLHLILILILTLTQLFPHARNLAVILRTMPGKSLLFRLFPVHNIGTFRLTCQGGIPKTPLGEQEGLWGCRISVAQRPPPAGDVRFPGNSQHPMRLIPIWGLGPVSLACPLLSVCFSSPFLFGA